MNTEQNSKAEFLIDPQRGKYLPEYHYLIKSIYTCFKMKVEDGYDFKGESHIYWEMVYVIDGSIMVKEDDKEYKINKGDIIFHKPMEFHSMRCTEKNASFLIISFLCNDDSLISPLGEGIFTMNLEQIEAIESVYRDVLEAFEVNIRVYRHTDEKQDMLKERMAFLKYEFFLLSILSALTQKSKPDFTAKETNYKIIIDVLTENIKKKLTVDEIAALCNMSTSNLKKIFNQHYDGGIIHYFTRMKINRAIFLLRVGFSVENVSDSVGFSNQSYFSRVFRKETGMTPSEFKKQKSRNQ